MPVVVAVGGKQPRKEALTSRAKRNHDNGRIEKKPRKQRGKRDRNQRIRDRRVLAIGEQPRERVLKKGKVRQFDLLCKHGKEDSIPRKARELMAGLTRWKEGQGATIHNGEERTSREDRKTQDRNSKSEIQKLGNYTGCAAEQSCTGHKAITSGKVLQHFSKNHESKTQLEGMNSGESLSEYSARLRKESKQMAIDIAKRENHQSEKRRAYNKKRRERAARRKRRRGGGVCSDSDVEDEGAQEDENVQRISHLPAFWQEIVHNNGRPVSTKKRRRMMRKEKETAVKVAFGDQVDRPPKLTVRPVHRGRSFTDVV